MYYSISSLLKSDIGCIVWKLTIQSIWNHKHTDCIFGGNFLPPAMDFAASYKEAFRSANKCAIDLKIGWYYYLGSIWAELKVRLCYSKIIYM